MLDMYPVVPWATIHNKMMSTWEQGQHVFVNAPTGMGKTTLIAKILDRRKYVVIFCTKVHDKTLSNDFPGFERIYEWPPKFEQNKVLLWPKPGKSIRETVAIQKRVFQNASDKLFLEQNWCVVWDEQHYQCQTLGLTLENQMFLHQARSSGSSQINAAQRPAWIPLATLNASTHCFIWRNTLDEDLKRLGNIGGIDKKQLVYNLLNMTDEHQFVYLNARKGYAVRSKVER